MTFIIFNINLVINRNFVKREKKAKLIQLKHLSFNLKILVRYIDRNK